MAAASAIVAVAAFYAATFSKDGAPVYLLRRGARSWEVVSFDVGTGAQKKVSELSVPLTADLQGFSLNPTGKTFATSIGTTRHDIRLMEDFARTGGWSPFRR